MNKNLSIRACPRDCWPVILSEAVVMVTARMTGGSVLQTGGPVLENKVQGSHRPPYRGTRHRRAKIPPSGLASLWTDVFLALTAVVVKTWPS